MTHHQTSGADFDHVPGLFEKEFLIEHYDNIDDQPVSSAKEIATRNGKAATFRW